MKDVGERRINGICQHVCSRNHGYAQDNGDHGQDSAELAAEESAEGDASHPRPFITSRISSIDPAAWSRTMRPSPRKTTRSAAEAAVASCVTMTIVWPKSSTDLRNRL